MMIKASDIKSAFEMIALRIQNGDSFMTPLGFKPIYRGGVVIRSVGSLYSIRFIAFDSALPSCGFCLARSYPMSYKAAHRLVCSL